MSQHHQEGGASEHPNARLLQEAFAVLAQGDMDGFLDYWSDDAVLLVPGTIPLAGRYEGKGAIRDAINRTFAIAGPSLRMDMMPGTLANDRYVVSFFAVSGEHNGLEYKSTNPAAAQLDAQRKIVKWWWLPTDQNAWNEFWR